MDVLKLSLQLSLHEGKKVIANLNGDKKQEKEVFLSKFSTFSKH